jgi:Ni,Fe-hydrogenase III component G
MIVRVEKRADGWVVVEYVDGIRADDTNYVAYRTQAQARVRQREIEDMYGVKHEESHDEVLARSSPSPRWLHWPKRRGSL